MYIQVQHHFAKEVNHLELFGPLWTGKVHNDVQVPAAIASIPLRAPQTQCWFRGPQPCAPPNSMLG